MKINKSLLFKMYVWVVSQTRDATWVQRRSGPFRRFQAAWVAVDPGSRNWLLKYPNGWWLFSRGVFIFIVDFLSICWELLIIFYTLTNQRKLQSDIIIIVYFDQLVLIKISFSKKSRSALPISHNSLLNTYNIHLWNKSVFFYFIEFLNSTVLLL